MNRRMQTRQYYTFPPRNLRSSATRELSRAFMSSSENKLTGVLNASLPFVLLTWILRTFMNSSSERLFHLTDTYKSLLEMPGISFKKWSHDEACVKAFCELVYARNKRVKPRESSRASNPGGVASKDGFFSIFKSKIFSVLTDSSLHNLAWLYSIYFQHYTNL